MRINYSLDRFPCWKEEGKRQPDGWLRNLRSREGLHAVAATSTTRSTSITQAHFQLSPEPRFSSDQRELSGHSEQTGATPAELNFFLSTSHPRVSVGAGGSAPSALRQETLKKKRTCGCWWSGQRRFAIGRRIMPAHCAELWTTTLYSVL